MTKTRKILSLLLTAALMVAALVGIFAAGAVSAAEDNRPITLKSAALGEFSGGVTTFSYVDNSVNVGLTFHYIDESAEFLFTFENSSDTDYYISSVYDTNNNDYFSFGYSDTAGVIIKANSDTEVKIKLSYSTELEDPNERSQRLYSNIVFDFTEYVNPEPAPKTGNDSVGYIIAAAVCAAVVIAAALSGKNGRKCAGMFMLVLAVIIVMPISADAAEDAELKTASCTVNVSGTVNLYDKLTVTYDYYGDGTYTDVCIVDYLGEVPTLEGGDPTRDGYTFKGWYDNADNEPSFYTQVGYDLTFTAKWEAIEYKITYDIGEGTLGNGKTNPSTYKITDSDITLNNPTREGYYFVGWMEDETSDAVKTLTIESGSYGNKNYIAKYAEYLPAKIRKYGANDNNVSWTLSSDNQTYVITQAANSIGWGATGAVCDDSKITTVWGDTYMLEFSVFLNNDVNFKVDANCEIDGVTGNDGYGDFTLVIDGKEYDGRSIDWSVGVSLKAGLHEFEVFITNNNTEVNTNANDFVGYTSFGVVAGSSAETYEIRNLKAALFIK